MSDTLLTITSKFVARKELILMRLRYVNLAQSSVNDDQGTSNTEYEFVIACNSNSRSGSYTSSLGDVKKKRCDGLVEEEKVLDGLGRIPVWRETKKRIARTVYSF